MRPRWAGAALLIVLVFWGLAARRLDRPGLYDEEASDAEIGMQAVLGMQRIQSDWRLPLPGRSWPLRGTSYSRMGFEIQAAALGFAAGGAGVTTLRATALALASALLVAFFGACELLFGLPAALAASLLLATNPTFLITSRVGFMCHELFIALFALAAVWGVAAWRKHRRDRYLYAGLFSLGFAINVSIKAAAYWAALPLAYAALAPRKARPDRRRAALGALSFLAGAANILLYELAHGLPISRLLAGSFAPDPAPAATMEFMVGDTVLADNLHPWRAVAVRLRQLAGLLDATMAARPVSELARPCLLTAPAVLACAAFLLWRARSGERRRLDLGVVAVPVLLFTAACFSPAALSPQHLLVMWPFLFALFAAAFSRARRPAWVAAAFVALGAAQLWTFRDYAAGLEATGGRAYWSDSVESLAEDLDRRGILAPVCLTWGVGHNLSILTQGRVRPRYAHRFRAGVDDELRARYDALLREPESRFVLFAPGVKPDFARSYGYFAALEQEAARERQRLVLEKTFADREGIPVYEVYAHARL